MESLPLTNKSGILRPQNSIRNIELGLTLYPATREVAIITDAGLEGRLYNEYFKSLKVLPSNIHLKLINGSDTSTAEMLAQVAALPPESFVVYFNWKSAVHEDFQTFAGVASKFAAVSPGPVFCVNDAYLDNGFMGGFLTPGGKLGTECAKLCERILATETHNAAQFPISYGEAELVINYPVLEKFVPSSSAVLPENVKFFNRGESFWIIHFWGILAFLVVTFFLGSWCTFLLVRRRDLLRNKTIFSHMPVRVVVCDRKGKIYFLHNCDAVKAEAQHKITYLKDLPYDLANKFAVTLNLVFCTGEAKELEYSDTYGKRRAYFAKLPTPVFGRETVMWVSIDTKQLANAQAELEASLNFLNITLRSIGDGVIVTDAAGKIKICNPVAEELTQYTSGSAIGRSCNEVFNIVSYQDGRRVESPVEKALKTNCVVKLANHTDLIARDGSRRHVADSAAPIINSDGQLHGCVLVFRDVTREYDLRDQQRRSHELLSKISSFAQMDYFYYSFKNENLNNRDCKFWPTRADGTALAIEEWVYAEDVPEFRRRWHDLLNGKIKSLEISYRVFDHGSMRHFAMWAASGNTPSTDENGRFEEVFGFIQEITLQKEIQLAAEKDRLVLRALLDNLPVGICVKNPDKDLRFVLCNKLYHDKNGLNCEEVLDKTGEELGMSPEISRIIRRSDDAAVKQGRIFFPEEIAVADGSSRNYDTTKEILRLSSGERLLVITNVETTARVQLENRLRETLKRTESYILIERVINKCLQHVTLQNGFSESVNYILHEIGRSSGADRCVIYRYTGDMTLMSNEYEWCADGIISHMALRKNIPANLLPDVLSVFAEYNEIVISDTENCDNPKFAELANFFGNAV